MKRRAIRVLSLLLAVAASPAAEPVRFDVSSSGVRAAHMALNVRGISHVEGFVGPTIEDSVRNLSRIGDVGMSLADATMLDIMIRKTAAPAEA